MELIDDIRYSVFIAHLEKLNDQRQKAVEEGRGIESIAADIMLKAWKERALEAISMDYQDGNNPQVSFRRVEKMNVGRLAEWFPDENLSPEPGQMVQIPMSKEEIWIVKYMEFFPSDDVPYEQIRERLVPGVVNDAYDRMVQQRIQDAIDFHLIGPGRINQNLPLHPVGRILVHPLRFSRCAPAPLPREKCSCSPCIKSRSKTSGSVIYL